MKETDVDTAKLFASGRSQAVRLPKAFRFRGSEVVVKRFGTGVLLLPLEAPWGVTREALDEFEPDLRIERQQPPAQERSSWSG